MKIKLIRSIGIKGECFEAGTSMDVDDETALSLIAMGRAEKAKTAEAKKKKS